VRFQKLSPGCPFLAFGSWVDAMLPQDGGDGPPADLVAQVGEGSLNPRVAPIAILGRHAHDQLPNFCGHGWPAWSAPQMAVVFPCDQVPVPGEQGVRAHNRPELPEHPPA